MKDDLAIIYDVLSREDKIMRSLNILEKNERILAEGLQSHRDEVNRLTKKKESYRYKISKKFFTIYTGLMNKIKVPIPNFIKLIILTVISYYLMIVLSFFMAVILQMKGNSYINLSRELVSYFFNTASLLFVVVFITFMSVITTEDDTKSKHFKKIKEDYEKIRHNKKQILTELDQLQKDYSYLTDSIPLEFRNKDDIAQLYYYLDTGRADSLKEAYNVLENNKNHLERMSELRKIGEVSAQNNQKFEQHLLELNKAMSYQNDLGRARLVNLEKYSTNATHIGVESRKYLQKQKKERYNKSTKKRR